MDARTRNQQRNSASERRRKPGDGRLIHIPFDGNCTAGTEDSRPPSEIVIEATDASGSSADWLNDYFWLDIIREWSRQAMVIHFLPTHEGLLNDVVIHQANMLRRIAPDWRLVAECYLSDLAAEGRLAQAALTPYHEIRVIDAIRPGAPQSAHPLRMNDAIARIRQTQTANNRSTPVITRCAANTAEPIRPVRTTPATNRTAEPAAAANQ